MDCSKFALYVLKELGILSDLDKPKFKILTWLNKKNDIYYPTRQVSFFDETCRKNDKELYSFSDTILEML